MAVLRLPNAPSIPSHGNVFGYEETTEGELIQQPNPEKVFMGTHGDTVGPGHYEVKDVKWRKTGTNWHASKVKRPLFTSSATQKNLLGPGSYDITKTPSKKVKGTSCFVSAVPRTAMKQRPRTPKDSDSNSDNDSPGPGHYNPKVGAFQERVVSGPVQQFGFTAPRFAQPKNPTTANIGPGQYGDFRKTNVRVEGRVEMQEEGEGAVLY
eukprot:TRINITY_DN17366_c0_g1_i1.p1 TRINITY_DN17366_c0_g1~~TRINITY_DN17366_c0_g1_i1.p1  ORF type:complete len:209 (-),score=21.38 TRINITY_DN17366_c0_g1_i1:251-877(-)